MYKLYFHSRYYWTYLFLGLSSLWIVHSSIYTCVHDSLTKYNVFEELSQHDVERFQRDLSYEDYYSPIRIHSSYHLDNHLLSSDQILKVNHC